MNNLCQFVIFAIDEQRYALPLSEVERIVRAVEITPLPKAPEIVLGVVDVQERITPVINIRRRFGLPEKETELSDQLIIARTSNRSVALPVDSVSGVVEFQEKEVTEAGEIFPGMEYAKAAAKQDEGMFFILDLDAMLYHAEGKTLDTALKKAKRNRK